MIIQPYKGYTVTKTKHGATYHRAIKIQVKDYSEEFTYRVTPKGLTLVVHRLGKYHERGGNA